MRTILIEILAELGQDHVPELVEKLKVRGVTAKPEAVHTILQNLNPEQYTFDEVYERISFSGLSKPWLRKAAKQNGFGQKLPTAGRGTSVYTAAEMKALRELARWSQGERRGRPKKTSDCP